MDRQHIGGVTARIVVGKKHLRDALDGGLGGTARDVLNVKLR
jgi:hypothetical protein